MKRNYHQARKCRQLKYAVKQFKNKDQNDLTLNRSLTLKIKRLVNQLKSVIPAFRLKRLLAPALLVLGNVLQNPVEAQQFAEPVQNPFGIFTTIPEITAPVLVDIDNDGDLDLFSGGLINNYTSGFYFQENIGNNLSPVFGQVKENPFGLNKTQGSFYPSFADLDDDGDLDLIATSNIIDIDDYLNVPYTKIGITYYENVGNSKKPEFQSLIVNPFNFTIPEGSDFTYPEFGDLDNDGDFDILVSDSDGAITYYQNIGTKNEPNFDQPVSNPFGINLINDYSVLLRLSDMDNDGDLDLIRGQQLYNDYTEFYDAKLFYYENNGDASSPSFGITDSIQLVSDALNGIALPTLGDLDGDSDLDMIVSQFRQPTLYYENEGDGLNPLFKESANDNFGIHQFKTGVINVFSNTNFVDLDADGDLDLVLGYTEYIDNEEADTLYGRIKYYENTGDKITSEFTTVTKNPFEKFTTYYLAVPTLTDIDKDGDLDLFVSDYNGNIYFASNVGNSQNPQFNDLVSNQLGITPVSDEFTKLVFKDMDNDGDLDLLKNDDSNLIYFENISTNNQILFQYVDEPFNSINIEFESTIIPAITDIDNDGDYDLFIHDYQNQFYYLENIGTRENATFGNPVKNPFEFKDLLVIPGREEYSVFPTFADLDADGDQDLIFGSYYGSFYYYENVDSIPVNITEIEQLHTSIYPNPTTDILHLTKIETINQIEIINIMGQTLRQFSKPQNTISLSDLPAATYFVKITDINGAHAVRKLLKQ